MHRFSALDVIPHLPLLSRRHLTKFGGFLSIPTSVDELLQELKSEFKINDIAFDVLSNFDAADNPTIMNVTIVLVFLNVITVLFLGKYRGYRARVNRRRESRMLKDEQTAARMRSRGVQMCVSNLLLFTRVCPTC